MRRAALVLLPVVGLAALAGLTWVVLREPAVPAPEAAARNEAAGDGQDATRPRARVAAEEAIEAPKEPLPAEWTEARFRAELERAFADLPTRPAAIAATAAELDAAARRAHASWRLAWDIDQEPPDATVRAAARKLSERLALRERWGALPAGPVSLRFRARGSGRTLAAAASTGTGEDWFDPYVPPSADQVFTSEVRGGVIPEGHVLVVEAVDLQASLVTGTWESATVSLEPFSGLGFRANVPRLRARFEGAVVLSPGDEMDVHLYVSRATAQADLSARVVPDAEAPAPAALRFVAEGSEGFLVGDVAIRLQVLGVDAPSAAVASIDLTGRAGSRSEHASYPLWPDADVHGPRSLVHASGVGLVPPGHALHVREIEWRVRFADEADSRMFAVRGAGDDLVRRHGGHAAEDAGRWTGSVTVVPGKEWTFSVDARNGALGEALIRGRVEPRGD